MSSEELFRADLIRRLVKMEQTVDKMIEVFVSHQASVHELVDEANGVVRQNIEVRETLQEIKRQFLVDRDADDWWKTGDTPPDYDE